MKKSNLSNLIILTLVLTISFLIAIGSYYKIALKDRIYNDAFIVNQLGKIRGDIQRYSKLKIAKKNTKEVEKQIDEIFKKIYLKLSVTQTVPKDCTLPFFSKLYALKELWDKLKNTSINQIVPLSEKAWEKSNEVIDIFETIHKLKFNTLLRNLDIFVYISIVFLSLVTLIVYAKIKKGLEVDVITDKLTNLHNRLYFNEMYKFLINKFNRYKAPFSLIILDIDNFKKINDTYGHDKGDEILKKVSNIIKRSIRNSDLAFRYGGEEFVILLPETKLKEAISIAERIKENTSQNIKIDENPVTISGGVGEYKGENPDEFFKKVDSALYEAKNTGKNKIIPI